MNDPVQGHEVLRNLLDGIHGPFYVIRIKEQEGSKCQWCDDERMITLVAPDGQMVKEPCQCSLTVKAVGCTVVPVAFKECELTGNLFPCNITFTSEALEEDITFHDVCELSKSLNIRSKWKWDLEHGLYTSVQKAVEAIKACGLHELFDGAGDSGLWPANRMLESIPGCKEIEDIVYSLVPVPLYAVSLKEAWADRKCPLCDRDRMITAVGLNGQTARIPCSCSRNKKLRPVYMLTRDWVPTGSIHHPLIRVRFRNGKYWHGKTDVFLLEPNETMYEKPFIYAFFRDEQQAIAWARGCCRFLNRKRKKERTR